MVTARSTKNSASDGPRSSTAAKSPAHVAVDSSPRKANGARAAGKSPAAGTSVTTTSIEASIADRSIPAATEQPPRIALPFEAPADHANSPNGGEADSGAQAHLISVFGMFNSRALVEMSTAAAEALFGGSLRDAGPSRTIRGVEADLADLRTRSTELADSAFAGSAMTLAYEIDNPFNSATSKAMCAKALLDLMNRLRELAPPEEKRDGLDDLATRRAKRLNGGAAAAH